MSAFASRAHRQVQLSASSRTGTRGSRRGTLSLLLALVVTVAILTGFSLGATLSVERVFSAIAASFSPKTVVIAGAFPGGHVSAAIKAVQTEKDNVKTEQETFREFAEEVRSLSLAGQSIMGTNAQSVNTGPNDRALKQVRETYRETVMSTPDFDREYGETFRQHVASEFGDDVASLLTDGHQLNEPVKRLIVQQARQSARERELLLDGLGVEERSLEEATAALAPIQTTLHDIEQADLSDLSLSALAQLDAELRDRREECRYLLRTRQEEIHTVNRRVNGQSKTLTQRYLYGELPVRFPVLSAILDHLYAIENARSAIVEAVCRTS